MRITNDQQMAIILGYKYRSNGSHTLWKPSYEKRNRWMDQVPPLTTDIREIIKAAEGLGLRWAVWKSSKSVKKGDRYYAHVFEEKSKHDNHDTMLEAGELGEATASSDVLAFCEALADYAHNKAVAKLKKKK